MTITDSIDRAAEPRTLFERHSVSWRDVGIVFVVALACYFPYPLNTPLAATEGHRAMTAHQMVESGQWLIPKLYGRVYLAKPPLHYWILATSETLFHTTSPWVWRLPAAIEGALLAAILCLVGGRWFGRIGGLVSGLSYVALFTLWGENRGADIDVTNTLTATVACLSLIELHLGRRAGFSTPVKPDAEAVGDAPISSSAGDAAEAPGASPAACASGLLSSYAGSRKPWPWVLLAGVAVGASLMVKGPASLTIILGTYLALGFLLRRSVGWLWIARPSAWLPLLIGIGVFALYGVAAWWYMKTHGLARDLTGVNEGLQDLHRHNINTKQVVEWITLPAIMFLYSLPVSLSLVFGLNREIRGTEAVRARLMLALAWSVLLAWGVCFLSGMHLPRYAFVTLPLLCPLAGAVAARLPEMRRGAREGSGAGGTSERAPSPEQGGVPTLDYARRPAGKSPDHWVRVIVASSVVVFCAAGLVLSAMAWKAASGEVRAVLVVVALLVTAATAVTVRAVARGGDWRGAWGVPVVVLLVSVVFATRAYYDRLARMSVPQAKAIRKITGPDAHLITCSMVLDQPDLFYYTGLPTTALDGDKLDWWPRVPLGTWVVLEPPELKAWEAEVPGRLWQKHEFVANRNKGILVWYGDGPPPAAGAQ